MRTQSLWVLASAICFAVMGVFVKRGSVHFSSAELVFYRSIIGTVFMAVLMTSSQTSFRTPHWPQHVTRGVLGCVGLILYFYTIAILPLALAVTLNHTAPLFFALIVAVRAPEEFHRFAAAAVAVGFAGVVVLLRPTLDLTQILGCLIGLVVGVLVAIGYLFIRRLGELGEPETRTVFYYSAVCAATAGVWAALTGFNPVTLANGWDLLGVGVSATLAQLALTRAYKSGKSILTTSLTYTNVLFATIFGTLLWGEVLPPLTVVAVVLIIGSGILASVGAPAKKPAAGKAAA
jgi:drug/metabolite transporter (DMT)-like permease